MVHGFTSRTVGASETIKNFFSMVNDGLTRGPIGAPVAQQAPRDRERHTGLRNTFVQLCPRNRLILSVNYFIPQGFPLCERRVCAGSAYGLHYRPSPPRDSTRDPVVKNPVNYVKD